MTEKEKFNLVQQMQNYIEKNIAKSFSLTDLSKFTGYSKFYCIRMFKELTGKTPFEYVRSVKMTTAAKHVRDTNDKIINIAFDFEFDTPEGFTRSFAKEFGITPNKYRKEAPAIKFFTPFHVRSRYIMKTKGESKMANTMPLFVQVMERPKRKMILKRGMIAQDYFQYCNEVGCDVWGILCSVKEALYEPVGAWLPENLIRQNTSRYVQGVEVPSDYAKPIPEGFEIIDLPACKVMIFQSTAFNDDDFMDVIPLVQDAINTYDPTLYGFEWDDSSPRCQMEPWGARGYIEYRSVRAAKL